MRRIGSKHQNAKLKEKDIRKIRKMHKQGIMQKRIAKDFGVSKTTIYKILTGQTWTHVREKTQDK
jgi:DNA invertase Pin-like site-specific DNA recombinase